MSNKEKMAIWNLFRH